MCQQGTGVWLSHTNACNTISHMSHITTISIACKGKEAQQPVSSPSQF